MVNFKTRQFIEKARKVHGDKYSYDKTVYVRSMDKIIIICPNHGYFEQRACNHLQGNNCPKCNIQSKKKTTEQFISEAKHIHGSKYDYSKTVYAHSESKIIIICSVHGDFEQQAASHLNGSGCPKCNTTRKTVEQFISEANKKHNNKYLYVNSIYVGSNDKIIITCKKHGDFEQIVNNHLNGAGCPKCALNNVSKQKTITKEEFIKRAIEIHGDKYNYDNVNYLGSQNKIFISCKIHGDFEQYPHNHITGKGCPKCGELQAKKSLTKTTEYFIKRAKEIHGDKYNYDNVNYINSREYVKIFCPVITESKQHGDFEQIANNHLNGSGCPECYKLSKTKTTEQFISEANQKHNNKYSYDKCVYVHSESKVIITCPIHGDFEQQPSSHLNGSGCTLCSHQISKSEQEIVDYIKLVYAGPVEQSNRNILSGRELDIYLPSLNIAIEFNGLYWHNENNKSNNYHVQKTNDCEKQNIHLIQIFENEWLEKKEIVKSRLKQILGVNKDKKIYGRKCIIRELDAPTERMFMNNNHLQGYVASKVCYGLMYVASNGKEYLVAAMSFGSLRKNLGSSNVDGCYELYRFCNIKNHSVIGGANKLFKHFLNKFKPKKIISFANRRYSFINKNIYQNLGFTFESTTPPSYYYIQGTKLINRFALRKDVLVREYGCPENMTEREFCHEQGWFRIYDSGNLKYIYETK